MIIFNTFIQKVKKLIDKEFYDFNHLQEKYQMSSNIRYIANSNFISNLPPYDIELFANKCNESLLHNYRLV